MKTLLSFRHLRWLFPALIAVAYFLVFVPANLTGSHDTAMLSIFDVDERAQYEVLRKMLQPASSLYEHGKNIFHYHYYTYGFLFWVGSILTYLPFSSSELSNQILVLRQLSPLFMTLSILLLVYLWTGFRSLFGSIALFLFLGLMPAVFRNNMTWHPDSQAAFFAMLVIFALYKDDLRFRRWFLAAAFFCGLSIATKVVGVFFYLPVFIYLVLGYRWKQVPFKELVRHAAMFLVVMFGTILLAFPQLLYPGSRNEIIRAISLHSQVSYHGWSLPLDRGPEPWYREMLAAYCGQWWLYPIAVALGIWGIVYDRQRRLLNILVLSWAFSYFSFLFLRVAFKTFQYPIPAMLPLLSCVGNPSFWKAAAESWRTRRWLTATAGIVLALLLKQTYLYVQADLGHERGYRTREETSKALKFFQQLDETVLSRFKDRKLVVFRETYAYVPSRENLDVRTDYGVTTYDKIEIHRPDLIVLDFPQADYKNDPANIDRVLEKDRELTRKSQMFYRDVNRNELKGYEWVLRTEDYTALIKTTPRLSFAQ